MTDSFFFRILFLGYNQDAFSGVYECVVLERLYFPSSPLQLCAHSSYKSVTNSD